MQTMYKSVELQTMANLIYQCSTSIDRLIENIGSEESRELLVGALPVIIARKNAILNALEQNDNSAACVGAHKAAGSIRLYGSSRLEELLGEVMLLSANQAPRATLRSELNFEFDSAIHEIQNRLRVGFS